MSFRIKSQIIDDYILLTATGSIFDLDEIKLLNERYFHEVNKNKLSKIIVDEVSLEKPDSLLNMMMLAEFYCGAIADKICCWRVAVLVDPDYYELARFWEYQTNKVGYAFKVFTSMKESLNYIHYNQQVDPKIY